MIRSIFILTLVTAAPIFAQDEIKLPAKDNFQLYLLVGQSNMAGRGKVEAQDKKPIPRVLTLDKTGRWVPAVDPLHFDKSAAGVGLGRTFGAEIAAADPGIVVGLIPCAVGGSPISAWKPGEYYAPTKSHPWDDAIKRAKLAQTNGTLKGILWHQGESDSNEKAAPLYEKNLHALVKAFRQELGPELPFVVGQLGQFEGVAWNVSRKQVDQVHREFPKKLQNVAFVESTGLKPMADKIHFDAASCREFGKRYAAAYLKLIAQPASEKK